MGVQYARSELPMRMLFSPQRDATNHRTRSPSVHTIRRQARFIESRLIVLLALGVVSVLAVQAQAAEQPKPGAEHSKLERCVGRWSYEGTAEPSPFAAAGRFKGKATTRMVLGGFFLENREEDKSDKGYIYQGVQLRGYDPVAKTYFEYAFENDGSVTSNRVTLSGNTWTATGTRTDGKGVTYKTRNVLTYAPDGRSFTFAAEYSADDGRTWLPLWKGSMKRVGK